jgi:hypothetical protein
MKFQQEFTITFTVQHCIQQETKVTWIRITINIPDTTVLGLMSEPPHICWRVPLEYLYIPTCHGNSPTLTSTPCEINGCPLGFLFPHTVRTQNETFCVYIARARLRGRPAGQLSGVPKYQWNKSEIWCQLTQAFTRNSLHNWQNVNANSYLLCITAVLCYANVFIPMWK